VSDSLSQSSCGVRLHRSPICKRRMTAQHRETRILSLSKDVVPLVKILDTRSTTLVFQRCCRQWRDRYWRIDLNHYTRWNLSILNAFSPKGKNLYADDRKVLEGNPPFNHLLKTEHMCYSTMLIRLILPIILSRGLSCEKFLIFFSQNPP